MRDALRKYENDFDNHASWCGTNQNPIALAAIEMSSALSVMKQKTSKDTSIFFLVWFSH